MQDSHSLAYLSKPLGPKMMGLSTYQKECLAVLMAVDRWRPYLQHKEFIVKVDQKSLVHLNDQNLTTQLQQKAFVKLIGLQFRMQFKKGVDNSAANALSRLPATCRI
uniref:Reverse transcriptase RNase H-like domain-containing protein n=1 Tax=Arundo donax TaxID=35708 RepID=A0A0A9HMP3_ARUDO